METEKGWSKQRAKEGKMEVLRLLLWMRERSEHGADFLSQYQLQLAGLFGCSHLKTLLESRDDTDGNREKWGHWASTQTPSEWGKSAAASVSGKKGRRDARDPKVPFFIPPTASHFAFDLNLPCRLGQLMLFAFCDCKII